VVSGNKVEQSLFLFIQEVRQITLDEICQTIIQQVDVSTVQRINQEEIFAGKLISTPFNILIHLKFGAVKIEMKVLTKAPPLTKSIISLLETIFK
jgi:AP-4 complex subunit epsilon-1